MPSGRVRDALIQILRKEGRVYHKLTSSLNKRGRGDLGTIRLYSEVQFISVQSLSRVQLFATLLIAECQASPSITSSQSFLNSGPLSWWWHPTISSSVILFSSHLQSFPTSWSFQMSQFFALGGQSIGVSASASVLPMDIQDWSPLGWTGGTSLRAFLTRSWGQIRLKAALIRVPGSPTHSIPLAPHTGDLQVTHLFTRYAPEQEEEMSTTPVFLLG